ncbi:hypothetical protein Rctr71_085 [Virus Rctr71]|nr:hypothetical protein Rctr71_085 [Virus Rctr71]
MLREAWLGKFFRKYGEVQVAGGTVYIRALSKPDTAERQRLAILAAQEARNEAKDKESAVYKAHVEPVLKSSDKGRLVESILGYERTEIVGRARTEIYQRDFPEAPESPTVSDLVDVAEESQRIEREVAEARRKYIEDATAARRSELEGMSAKALREECVKRVINGIVERAYADATYDATIYLCSFADKECKRRFLPDGLTTPAEIARSIAEVPEQVYDAIAAAYAELDSWNGETLKNSPVNPPLSPS